MREKLKFILPRLFIYCRGNGSDDSLIALGMCWKQTLATGEDNCDKAFVELYELYPDMEWLTTDNWDQVSGGVIDYYLPGQKERL